MNPILIGPIPPGQKINTLYAFIASDHNGEGIGAFINGETYMPLVCSQPEQIKHLETMARMMATRYGATMTLWKFTIAEPIAIITPAST